MKVSRLISAESVLAAELEDPVFRAEWDRTAFARQVANRLIAYRIEHGLTQTALARKAGTVQSVIARLEDGDHPPSLATLQRLSGRLGIHLAVDIDEGKLALVA
ncbi:MAG: helix-turn-helix transcriptional regulator [Mycobacteriales bacterium]